MKNKLFKGLSLSLSANPKHLIKGIFSAAQRVGDVKCLSNATLKDIYDTCKSCDKKNASCDVTLAFK